MSIASRPAAAPRGDGPGGHQAPRSVDAVVVGAGVVGLTVAVCLAEKGMAVRVYARDRPRASTSAVASAMIGPSFSSGQLGEWEREGVAEFTSSPTSAAAA